MGDGVKGTVTPLGSLFSHEEARKAARRVEETVVQRSAELRRLQGFVSENSALISLVRSLPDELSHEIMVPFGGAAFFPGRLIHTNEFLVLLGEGYYVERTAKQTADILHRRGKALEAQVEALKAMILDLEAEAKFFNSTAEEAFEGLVEIREEYVEEPAKNSLNSDNSLHSFKTENLQKFDEDEEYDRIMARIEELEREEELENGNTSKDDTQENEDTVAHDGDGGSKAADEDEDIEAGRSFSTSDHKYEIIQTKQKPKDPLRKASDQKILSSFISHQTGNIPKQQLKEESLLILLVTKNCLLAKRRLHHLHLMPSYLFQILRILPTRLQDKHLIQSQVVAKHFQAILLTVILVLNPYSHQKVPICHRHLQALLLNVILVLDPYRHPKVPICHRHLQALLLSVILVLNPYCHPKVPIYHSPLLQVPQSQFQDSRCRKAIVSVWYVPFNLILSYCWPQCRWTQ